MSLHRLMLGTALLLGAFALMTMAGGSVKASTNSFDATVSWQTEVEEAPKAVVTDADTCVPTTIFHTPVILTSVGIDASGLSAGSSPESTGPCQYVVECTLTHWG